MLHWLARRILFLSFYVCALEGGKGRVASLQRRWYGKCWRLRPDLVTQIRIFVVLSQDEEVAKVSLLTETIIKKHTYICAE